jgi:biotin synthase-like enzyme
MLGVAECYFQKHLLDIMRLTGTIQSFYFLNVQYDKYIAFKSKIFQKICKYCIVLKRKKILNLQKRALFIFFL